MCGCAAKVILFDSLTKQILHFVGNFNNVTTLGNIVLFCFCLKLRASIILLEIAVSAENADTAIYRKCTIAVLPMGKTIL